MIGELSWRDAIVRVLSEAGAPMHYTEIAEAITGRGLKKTLGATPAATVNSVINVSIEKDGNASAFVRIKRGEYALRSLHLAGLSTGVSTPSTNLESIVESDEEVAEPSAIQALGMFWRRELVNWTTTPVILGQQQRNSSVVDFCAQHGIYLLHDGRETVYVGRATDQPLGRRLAQHTTDRLNGRWDRFSWFGIDEVTDSGDVKAQSKLALGGTKIVIELEAVLIESLEPPLNRRRGDGLRAVEYIQVEDPAIKDQQRVALVAELLGKRTK